jgi:hypothetical protein
MADFDLDPLGFDPASFPQATQDGIDDTLDHGDSGHLLHLAADLPAIQWSVPKARQHRKIETALAELALPHLRSGPLAIRSAACSKLCRVHGLRLLIGNYFKTVR